MLTPRPSARVVLTDGSGRVLLFQGFDPARPQELFWFTVGGGVEGDEELRDTAVRETFEETGHRIAADALVGPVWRRRAVFSFDGQTFDAEEWFFHASVPELAVDTSGFNDVEETSISAYRWWTAEELAATEDTVYPVQLAELLPALTSGEWDGTMKTVR
ncbi:NUDIX hydrolase [Lentzea guizhouensis]|uniref:NUDIX hydrolase n=1 Tax=Lentzea guizhouensis TaxID=1586287 RepID=UPI001F37944B|nr:NUDIX domain-containing protein [Lentzea guizhouensis]